MKNIQNKIFYDKNTHIRQKATYVISGFDESDVNTLISNYKLIIEPNMKIKIPSFRGKIKDYEDDYTNE